LVVPVPRSTAEVSGGSSISRGEDAASFNKIISGKACKAVSWRLVEWVTLGTDCSADSLIIEEGSLSAFKASIFAPSFTEKIVSKSTQELVLVGNTLSFSNDGSIVALCAGAGGLVPWWAEVADFNTHFVSIEVPSLWALAAHSVFPLGASNFVWCAFIDFSAFAIDNWVSLIAFLADSFFGIELFACTLDFAADSVFIEVVSVGALDAGVLTPNFTAKIVVELGKKSFVIELVSRELVILCDSLPYE
jgi:hypothetical protein